MPPKNSSPDIEHYFARASAWREFKSKLREIILSCNLTEEYKWYKPCYSFDGQKILLIHGFKEFYAILFFKGALMADPEKILVSQTENVQATKQIRFTKLEQIDELENIIKQYIYEAIEIEKAGLKVSMKQTSEFKMPEEFKEKLAQNPELSIAFEALTPGRQRGYLLYFSGAKQSKTRLQRVDKCVPQILDGKGLMD